MREFSVPASFDVGEHDNIVSAVYSHERDDPDHVIFQRLVDGAVEGRDCGRGGKPDPFGGTGLDRRGRQARRPRGDAVGDPLRMADHRLRDPVRRRADRPDLRDQFGRAGELRARRFRRGAGVRRDRRARGEDRGAHGRPARPAQGVPDRRHRYRRRSMRSPRPGKSVDAGRTGRPAGRDQVDRPRHADLHLGHHRQAQGLPADALQSAVRDPRRQGVLPDAAAQGRAPAGVPAAGARAGPRDSPSRRSRTR